MKKVKCMRVVKFQITPIFSRGNKENNKKILRYRSQTVKRFFTSFDYHFKANG